MGVPGFFSHIKSRYPMAVQRVSTVSVIPQCDNLLIDVNALIHDATHDDSDMSMNASYEVVASRVMMELDTIMTFVNPQKMVYILADGTVPRNKLIQQRRRRFMTAKEHNNVKITGTNLFDKNQITTGTVFMEVVGEIIQYYIALRISTDPVWKKVSVLYSSHRCPGEGEHKMFQYLRQLIADKQYKDSDHTLCYGSDADIILLALTLHKKNVNIIRKVDYSETKYKIKNDEFFIVDIPLLSEFLIRELTNNVGSWMKESDKERVIDDYVFLLMLCGNDFMPQLPFVNIKCNVIQWMMETYVKLIEEYKCFIVTKTEPSVKMTKRLLEIIGTKEEEVYRCNFEDYKESLRKVAAWKCTEAVSEEEKEIAEARKSEVELLNVSSSFETYRRLYYQVKMGINPTEVSLEEASNEYYTGLVWSMNYYYKDCVSWSWMYSSVYSPLASDMAKYINGHSQFEMSEPFTPFLHMLCCLPPVSAYLLPPSYSCLITDPESPLAKYYPTEFCTDRNGKRKEYESVVILPCVCEKDVLEAVANHHCDDSLTEEEKARNVPAMDCLFYYSEKESIWPTPLDPSAFPDIEKCHCIRETVNDLSCLYRVLKRYVTEETRKATFASLYPICTGFHYAESQRPDHSQSNPTYNWTPENRFIVETESGYPYIEAAQSLKDCGKDYLNQIVEFDYPKHKYGQVMELLSHDFCCRMTLDKTTKLNRIDTYTLKKEEKDMVKEEFRKIIDVAMNGFGWDSHDMGNLDIGKNRVLARIRPFCHISRRQETQALCPFLSKQTVDYPLCLVRKVRVLNYLGGTQMLSDYSPYSVNKGDPVVYIGNAKMDERELKGYSGVIEAMNEKTLTVHLKVPTKVVSSSFKEDWYTEDYVREQLPKKYAYLVSWCLHSRPYHKGDSTINCSFNCSAEYNVLGGLTKTVSNSAVQRIPELAMNHSPLGVISQITNEEILYSDRAIELVKAYFRKFGDILINNVTFYNGKLRIKDELMESVPTITKWLKENVRCYQRAFTDSPMEKEGSMEHLLNDEKKELMDINVICSRQEVIIRENQYNVVSDAVLSQPLPSLGNRVVVIQHPCVPFGSQGTVVEVNFSTQWLKVLLDEPSYAGVSMQMDVVTNDYQGRYIPIHKDCCYALCSVCSHQT